MALRTSEVVKGLALWSSLCFLWKSLSIFIVLGLWVWAWGFGQVNCFTNFVAILRLSDMIVPANLMGWLRSCRLRFLVNTMCNLKYFSEQCCLEQVSTYFCHISCLLCSISFWIVFFSIFRIFWSQGLVSLNSSLSRMSSLVCCVGPGVKFGIFPCGMLCLVAWSRTCRKAFSPVAQVVGGGRLLKSCSVSWWIGSS